MSVSELFYTTNDNHPKKLEPCCLPFSCSQQRSTGHGVGTTHPHRGVKECDAISCVIMPLAHEAAPEQCSADRNKAQSRLCAEMHKHVSVQVSPVPQLSFQAVFV